MTNVAVVYRNGESPVTVQLGYSEDGEFIMEQCNHAGAYEEEMDFGGLYPDSVGDLDWKDDMRTVLVCDRCDWVDEEYGMRDYDDYDRDYYDE